MTQRLPTLFIILTLVCSFGFASGWMVQEWRTGAGETKTAVRTVYVTRKQGAINTTSAAQAVKHEVEIRYLTRTIIKEIPRYVSAETDRDYPLPVGLIRVHDAAAVGIDPARLSDPAGLTDDQASDVEASEAASAIAGNYGQCRADQARLSDLQDWLLLQAKAFRSK